MMAALYGHDEGIHNIVVIGLPDVKALERAAKKLELAGIPHFNWKEPDFDYGFTAICTAPIAGARREALKNYRVYSPGVGKPACLFTEDGGASL